MTYAQSLEQTIQATHESIGGRLAEVRAPDNGDGARETHRTTDAFLAATSRHLAAVDEVLVPAVQATGPDGGRLATEYLAAARHLESDLCLVKARLYGEAHAVRLSWPELLQVTHEDLSRHDELETALGALLLAADTGDADVDDLAQQMFRAELRAPTRPHPYLPHTGRFGKVARRLWAVADRFWDNAQGRMVPEPTRPAHHRHDSLMAQYLVADPHFDGTAVFLEHRHHHDEPT